MPYADTTTPCLPGTHQLRWRPCPARPAELRAAQGSAPRCRPLTELQPNAARCPGRTNATAAGCSTHRSAAPLTLQGRCRCSARPVAPAGSRGSTAAALRRAAPPEQSVRAARPTQPRPLCAERPPAARARGQMQLKCNAASRSALSDLPLNAHTRERALEPTRNASSANATPNALMLHCDVCTRACLALCSPALPLTLVSSAPRTAPTARAAHAARLLNALAASR